jgi:hypothetical protein
MTEVVFVDIKVHALGYSPLIESQTHALSERSLCALPSARAGCGTASSKENKHSGGARRARRPYHAPRF